VWRSATVYKGYSSYVLTTVYQSTRPSDPPPTPSSSLLHPYRLCRRATSTARGRNLASTHPARRLRPETHLPGDSTIWSSVPHCTSHTRSSWLCSTRPRQSIYCTSQRELRSEPLLLGKPSPNPMPRAQYASLAVVARNPALRRSVLPPTHPPSYPRARP